jgi:hypothetical protein
VALSRTLCFLLERKKDGDRCGITADCQKSGNDELQKKTKRERRKKEKKIGWLCLVAKKLFMK